MNLLRGLSVTAAGRPPSPGRRRAFSTTRGSARSCCSSPCCRCWTAFANIGAVDFRRDFAFHKEFAIMVLPKLCGIIAAITAAVLLRSYVAMLVGMGVNRTLRVVMSYVMHPYRPRLSLRRGADWRVTRSGPGC